MKEMKQYTIAEICSRLSSGKGIPASKVTPTGPYPVIGGNGVRGYTDSFNFDGECAIIGRQGANCGNVRYFQGKAYMTEHAIVAIGNENANTKYLACLFSLMHLGNLSAQSAQPGLSVQTLSKQIIYLPEISTQNQIADIIKSLDTKIELNNRINHNLEQQAQALYKSWFVDFEPFKGGKFVDSELGMIPEGWRVAELGTVTRQSSQKVKDRIDVKVLSPVTTGELVLSEEYFTKQVFSESISKYIVVKPLHFAYNPARVNIGSIGMNMFSFDGCVSPVYVVFECEKGYHHFFDYYRKTESFKDEVLNRAIGGVRQTLSYKDFALIKLVYPPYDIVEKFNCIYAGLLENKNSIKREISKLSELRDTLLPKLLSGELKIDDFTC